jgi:hypothetical protein
LKNLQAKCVGFSGSQGAACHLGLILEAFDLLFYHCTRPIAHKIPALVYDVRDAHHGNTGRGRDILQRYFLLFATGHCCILNEFLHLSLHKNLAALQCST